MAYLDVYIIGLGNLGTAFLEGLNSNNNLNLHLYEENDDIRENYSKKFNLSIFKNLEKIDSLFNYSENVNSKITKGSPSNVETSRMIKLRKTQLTHSSKFIKKQQNLITKSEILLEKSIKNLSGGGN